MPTPREREMNRTRVARWRAANLERARQQWRDYYRRNADAINFKRKLADCGIDPKMIQQQEYA